MKRLVKSFGYAFEGIWAAVKTERTFQIELVATLLVIALGLYVGLPLAKWCLVAFAIGFVLVSELFNTSIERLSSEVADGKQSPAIKTVKDVSAAAVFFSALTALVVGILVLFIPLASKICSL